MSTRNITVIAEHSVCLEILPNDAAILDAGCRGFEFTNYFKSLITIKGPNPKSYRVIPCDIDDLPNADYTDIDPFGHMCTHVKSTLWPSDHYYRIGVSHENSTREVLKSSDPQATRLSDLSCIQMQRTFGKKVILRPVFSIGNIASRFNVKHWDLVKLDVEGEEYSILTNCQHPIADQVSVEFHEHTDAGIGKEKLDQLLETLSEYYEIHNQNWESRHGAGFNYWDILLISKTIKK